MPSENIAKERKMNSNFIKYMYTNTPTLTFLAALFCFEFHFHSLPIHPARPPQLRLIQVTSFQLSSSSCLQFRVREGKKATNARCVDESSSLSTSLFVRTRVEVRRRAVAGECETSIRLNSVHRCEPPRDFEIFSCKRCSCICRGAYVWADDEEGKRAHSPSDKNILKRFMVCCACWPYICCQIGLRRRPATSRERKYIHFSLSLGSICSVLCMFSGVLSTQSSQFWRNKEGFRSEL